MLSVDHVSFSYDKAVLCDISFNVRAGELLVVLGPNGSGKSTLLHLLNGELKPDPGTVTFEGKSLDQFSRREIAQRISYVPQESTIRFPLTVTEFILQGRFAHIRGLGFESEGDLEAGREAMRLTSTEDFADRRINEISGGERQRVLLARALAQNARLLLLDELTANLDISFQVSMLEMVKRLTNSRKIAAVVVTHELNLAAEFADSVLLLQKGELVGLGEPRDVLTEQRLQSLFRTKLMVDQNPLSGAPRITFSAQ
ncbi:MAG TPA: ABC transporter ATP-binding protein [Blastocatellia bacterium]|nr:ABC transporter ATP-binding protein [Blastocatellia bacterium]